MCGYMLLKKTKTAAAVTFVVDCVTETSVEGTFGKLNHYDNDGPPTTNHVEGWHNRLNKKCGSAHRRENL